MLKKILFPLLLVLFVGCTYEGKTLRSYLEDPRSIIQDPHFSKYQARRDALESQYLSKEITYAEYVEKMNKLDDTYSREVQERTDIITNTGL